MPVALPASNELNLCVCVFKRLSVLGFFSKQKKRLHDGYDRQKNKIKSLVQHTCLIGCHIKCHILLSVVFGQLWHPIDSLQQKAVVGVWLQVSNHHRGVWQAKAAWQKAYVGTAFLQPPTVWQDPSAEDIVAYIFPATCLHGNGPLQKDARLIDIGNGIPWSGGRAWERWKRIN